MGDQNKTNIRNWANVLNNTKKNRQLKKRVHFKVFLSDPKVQKIRDHHKLNVKLDN